MLGVLTSIDYGLLVLYLAALISVGMYLRSQQTSTEEFFLAGRSFGAFPLGLSLMAALISALTYTGIPGQAYYVGLKVLVMPLAVWIGLPLIVGWVVPIYRGLGLYSIYEYLELRFDSTTRLLASLLFVVWRLLWLGGVIYAPCKALLIASDWDIPAWPLILVLGMVTTFYTFLGGMKAVVWTDVIQGMAMLLGIAVVIVGVWWQLDGGPTRVSDVSDGLNRLQLLDLNFSWSDQWSVWASLPHWVLAMLSFYIADQITAQRFLTARTINAARTSYLANAFALTLLMPGFMYIGLCLLTYYYDHPQQMRPQWVANVDAQTGLSVTDPQTRRKERLDKASGQRVPDPTDGQPLLDPRRPEDEISPVTIHSLVEQRRLLQPNSKEPFTDADALLDPDTNEVLIEKLAMRKPAQGKFRGEMILNRQAAEELLPHFVAQNLSWGAAGIAFAALLAASMSSVASGLNSICTLLVMDFHRRYGVGRSWLARRIGKSADDLNEVDEMRLAQPLTLVLGVAATVFSLAVAQIGESFMILIELLNTFGAPLLAVFLLGMFTRTTTAAGARVSLVGGILFTVYLMLVSRFENLAGLAWPFEDRIHGVWTVTLGTVFTLLLGYIVSLMVGKRKSKLELRGLVVGLGTPGVLSTDEEIPLLSHPENDRRWRR
jgi:sodium-dependent multivitamin transporter 6